MTNEGARGAEGAAVALAVEEEIGLQAGRWRCQYRLEKRHGDWTQAEIEAGTAPAPYEVLEREGNILVNAGILLMLTALTGGAITAFSNANARIAVGDSAAAAAATQTDLQAATNKVRVAMNATFPKVGTAGGLAADNQVQFQANFGSGVAEWAGGWQEWAIANSASGATILNRAVQNLGQKGASTTWTFTCTITVT